MPLWLFGAALLLCSGGLYLLSRTDIAALVIGEYSWTKENIAESERRGFLVRERLREFREQTGAYPKSLDEVWPQSAGGVPRELLPTTSHAVWIYEVQHGGAGFYLEFAASRDSMGSSRYLCHDSDNWGEHDS
jgi:hypothetical protein